VIPSSSVERVRLADAAKTIPAPCRERSTARGLGVFGRDVAVYAIAVVALLWSDNPWVLVVGWPLAGLAIASLFVLGHDAAHGALFVNPRLCRVVGQLAMLPSLHAYAVWVYGHNRIHHAFTTCGDLDPVWNPMTPVDWEAATPLQRLLHRVEWSCIGAGPYYGRVIWWQQIMRSAAPRAQHAAFRRDRLIVLGYFLLFSAALAGIGLQRHGSAAGIAWVWCKVFAVPWILWNFQIGWTVYLHHINPSIPWSRRSRWTKFRGQIEGTTEFDMPRWLDFFGHNIFHHVAHHVDPRIPFYHLPEASRALRGRFGAVMHSRRYGLREYGRITQRCKLFDFDREVWLRYPNRSAGPAASPVGTSVAGR
jgi:omega-6 fatty acid desaturase (delta-12 desaturase)